MKKMTLGAMILGFVALTAGCVSNPLKGGWRYSDGNAVIGLEVKKGDECEIRLSRFLGKDLKKSCRYEPNKQAVSPSATSPKSYLLYLRNDEGQCDVFADFEFIHDSQAGIVTFLVGDTPFKMQKIRN